MTLVILAAGMGSRFGSLKQVTPFGPSNEFIIDYSIYDALKVGFDKAVFIIKEENLDVFKETIGKRIEPFVDVSYAFQKLDDIPDGYNLPSNRVKPWGTTQALLCAKEYIDDKFLVINSDDFYGRDSFKLVYDFLNNSKSNHYCMAGYLLKNTVSENGSVNRGLCYENNDYLIGIKETIDIKYENKDIVYYENDTKCILNPNTKVSMNFWGFDKSIYDYIDKYFRSFLDENKDNIEKCEYYIPYLIDKMIKNDEASIKVLETNAKWYGVTYKEDKEIVVSELNKMIKNGIYPNNLWK